MTYTYTVKPKGRKDLTRTFTALSDALAYWADIWWTYDIVSNIEPHLVAE